MKTTLIYFYLIVLYFKPANAQDIPANVYYPNGMVVTAHPEASKVGLAILKKGGNAIDAAVAVQFALAVVYPNAGNIGGGGFMVYRGAKGEISTLDFREKAPALATRNMYLDSTTGNAIVDKSLYGHLASGVPGSVDGMVKAHAKYGKLPWQTLLLPAIKLAKYGFKITAMQAKELNKNKANFLKYNPSGTALLKQIDDWKLGDTLIQTQLSQTLIAIKNKGRAGFYQGRVAKCLISEINRGQGIISQKDLNNYQSIWRKPITGFYKNYKIITMPPPSSGGIALIQLLHAVENYPLAKWGANKDSTVQIMVEAERRVYADRATHMGDPDFYAVPQAQLLAKKYQKQRMQNFNWNAATPSHMVKAGELWARQSEETTHFCVVDKQGNAVSITTTLNGLYGSLVVVSGAGFLLNNEMDDFSVKPGSPNLYGLVGGEANAIAPNKRMLSSMTPTIIEQAGKLFMVVGTPGGSTIITSVFQAVLNVLEFNKTAQQAVSFPRFHHQWLPDEVFVEHNALNDSTQNYLNQKGYKITPREPMGRVEVILKTPKGLQGGADTRGDDCSLGY